MEAFGMSKCSCHGQEFFGSSPIAGWIIEAILEIVEGLIVSDNNGNTATSGLQLLPGREGKIPVRFYAFERESRAV